MEPVCRRTRRRTEEALIKRYHDYKKAKTLPVLKTDQAAAPFASPPESLASSRSSSSASAPAPVTISANPSPDDRAVQAEEDGEEEEVARSGCYESSPTRGDEADVDDVTVSVPEKPESCNSPPIAGVSSSSGGELRDSVRSHHHGSEESDFVMEEEEEEEVKEEAEEDENSRSNEGKEKEGGGRMESDFVQFGEENDGIADDKKIADVGNIDDDQEEGDFVQFGEENGGIGDDKQMADVENVDDGQEEGDFIQFGEENDGIVDDKQMADVDNVEDDHEEGDFVQFGEKNDGIADDKQIADVDNVDNVDDDQEEGDFVQFGKENDGIADTDDHEERDFVQFCEENGGIDDDKQMDDVDKNDGKEGGDFVQVGEENDGIVDDKQNADVDIVDDDGKEGGGGIEKSGRRVVQKRGKKREELTANEIHGVLFNSVLEEAKTDSAEELIQKPYEEEGKRSSSSDVDYGLEMDAKNPEQEEIDSMYRMMDFYLVDADNHAPTDAHLDDEDHMKTQEQLCKEGKHYLILDEEIGIICKLCSYVREEIKHVTAPFHDNVFEDPEKSPRYYNKYNGSHEPKNLPSFEDPKIDCQNSREEAEFDPKGTVWEIIPDLRKTLFPHQREAFEFIWRNVGGGTNISELMSNNKSDGGGGGCLISHAPGTGKTRLAIAFLETHMKLYKNTRPVILAPASILLTWKKEFERWKVEIPFLNLNDNDLSSKELSMASSLFGKSYEKNLTQMAKRLIKLLFWKRHESVLAISYTLFTQLAGGEDFKKRGRPSKTSSFLVQKEKLREMLLETPGLLILDEGHMPRNERSCMFNVLSNVKTKKRIILSGTPFQNNFRELHNILCLVREEFTEINNPFKSSVDKSDEGKIRQFKEKIKPFYHRYDGYIVSATVPGLIENTIYLQPSELQKKILKEEKEKTKSHLEATVNMTLVSVHPLLVRCKYTNPDFRQEIKRWDFADGAKTRFLIRLIELSSALEERVLVFSQYLQPLNFLKALLQSKECFGWREGIEILFMSGNQDMETRKRSMDLFNKPKGEAKVMLASTKACSEGIELIGASRVVLLDVTWNPSVEKQAISRAYRMGQEKVVHVYHLIMTDYDSDRHFSQTQKNKFSKYMFSSSSRNKKNDVVPGSSKAVCEDVILDRLLEEKIINEAVQQKACDAGGLHSEF